MSRSTSETVELGSRLDIQSTADLESTWKAAPSGWGHSLHSLAPYVGSFPPALAHYFIRRFTDVGDTVVDPMCGGGTVPLEAALHNRRGLGNDSFSYAYHLTRAKCNPVDTESLIDYLDAKLIAAASVRGSVESLLDDDDLRVFFSEYTLDQLLRLREVVRDDDSHRGAYLKAIVCGVLHGPSEMFLSIPTKDTYSGSVNYVRKYAERNDLDCPERDVRPSVVNKHQRAQADLVPPWVGTRTRVARTDARDLPFETGEADLVLTSPPYLAKLDYTWDNWLRLWWLGADRKAERDNLDMTADVGKYRAFIREALQEMYRVLADDSRAVLIVGDVQKRLANGPRTINTAGLIADEAVQHTGFEVETVLEDDYQVDDRRYVVFNQVKYDHDDTQTQEMATIDRCLVLRKGTPTVPRPPDIDWQRDLYRQE